MDAIDALERNRREFLKMVAAAAAFLAGRPLSARAAPRGRGMKIGVIGAGRIGSTLARLWAKAGYELLVSSRHLDQMKKLAAEIGPQAFAGTPREAAAFGEVVLVSVPYKALPQVGRDYAGELRGKVVLDTCNLCLPKTRAH